MLCWHTIGRTWISSYLNKAICTVGVELIPAAILWCTDAQRLEDELSAAGDALPDLTLSLHSLPPSLPLFVLSLPIPCPFLSPSLSYRSPFPVPFFLPLSPSISRLSPSFYHDNLRPKICGPIPNKRSPGYALKLGSPKSVGAVAAQQGCSANPARCSSTCQVTAAGN
jgi:hypothetical protein